MIIGNVTEPLRSLLEFESQKHGLPVRYQRSDLQYLSLEDPFRPEINILVHTDSCSESFCLPAGRENIPVRASVYPDTPGEPVGPEVNGEMVPLAYIKRRHVLIPFDLEALARPSNAINRLFDEIAALAMNQAVANIRTYDYAEEKATFAHVKVRALEGSIRKMQTDINDNDYTITTKTDEITELVRKNVELRDAMEAVKAVGPKRKEENALREFKELLKLQPEPYKAITFDNDTLTAETNPIEVAHEDYDYKLGRYQISIDFDADKMTITNLEPDRIVDGYHHPHISSPDSPCWGNVGVSVAKLLARKEYPPLLILVHQFLQSYNDSDPYLRIEKWDPDWVDDDDDFESCYDNASTQECIDCSRDSCPWFDDRYDRCREFADLDRCLPCGDCDQREVEIEACHDGITSWECLDCQTTLCPYAGDESRCHDSRNGDDCAECDQTECKFYPEEEKANDHIEDAPAVP